MDSRTTRLGRRSFFVAAPVVWNSLPLHLHSPSISRSQFRAELKTHLLMLAFHGLFPLRTVEKIELKWTGSRSISSWVVISDWCCEHLGKQVHKSVSKDQVVRVTCDFNTAVRRRVMITCSDIDEKTGSNSSQDLTKTVRNHVERQSEKWRDEKEDWVVEIRAYH